MPLATMATLQAIISASPAASNSELARKRPQASLRKRNISGYSQFSETQWRADEGKKLDSNVAPQPFVDTEQPDISEQHIAGLQVFVKARNL